MLSLIVPCGCPGWFCLRVSLRVMVKVGVRCSHLKAWLGLEKSTVKVNHLNGWQAVSVCWQEAFVHPHVTLPTRFYLNVPVIWQMDFPRVNDPREGKIEMKMLLWPNLGNHTKPLQYSVCRKGHSWFKMGKYYTKSEIPGEVMHSWPFQKLIYLLVRGNRY